MNRTALLASTLLLSAAGLVSSSAAEAGKSSFSVSYPADFEMTLCWGETSIQATCPWTENTLESDGTIEQTWYHLPFGLGDLEYSIFGDFDFTRRGKYLDIVWPGDSFDTYYEGTRTSEGCYEGIMYTTGNPVESGVWEGCIVN